VVGGERLRVLLIGREYDLAEGFDFRPRGGIGQRRHDGGIEASDAPPRLVHEPGNPQANAQGFVAYPAIDHVQQMTQLVQTARIYEANIVAMNIAREMYSRALQMGSTS